MAYQLYQDQISSGDQAYAVLISQIVPVGLRGILLAALFGAVLSSLDSLLNSSSTLFTMDSGFGDWRLGLDRADSEPTNPRNMQLDLIRTEQFAAGRVLREPPGTGEGYCIGQGHLAFTTIRAMKRAI
jgi:hypothetical protein